MWPEDCYFITFFGELGIEALAYAQNSPLFIHSFMTDSLIQHITIRRSRSLKSGWLAKIIYSLNMKINDVSKKQGALQ